MRMNPPCNRILWEENGINYKTPPAPRAGGGGHALPAAARGESPGGLGQQVPRHHAARGELKLFLN